MLDEQKRLLRDLAERQRAAIDRALKLGQAVPADLEVSMRAVLSEFLREEIQKAPQFLQQIILRFKLLAAMSKGPEKPLLTGLEREETAILEALQKGVPPPPMSSSQAGEADSAQRSQAAVREQTSQVERRLRDLADRTSTIPPKTAGALSEAQQEQSQAERSLAGRDSSKASNHEEKALELMDRGLKEMSTALERQKQLEQQMQDPFSSPRAGGRMRRQAGANTGFVPLPSSEEYQPTPEIRKELRKSVQEPRPKAFDRTIKDYFKRISE